MTTWRMRIACWITKTTNTHSEYIILIPFPLQRLHERPSMLRYTHIACIVERCQRSSQNSNNTSTILNQMECCTFPVQLHNVSKIQHQNCCTTIFIINALINNNCCVTAIQVRRSRVRFPKCHWHNPSGRTKALGSTQLLTEMSTRNIS
jgi:hypothetical protein